MSSGVLYEERELQQLLIRFPSSFKQTIPPPVKKKKIIVIAGPTGVGKTELSMMIASAIGGEIISADSMQVYRGMDIGTAKVSLEQREKVRHHLIDVRDLKESFNVADFFLGAYEAIKEILAKDHVPLVVGGTGFYINALLYGPPSGPPSVPELRGQLESEMDQKGVDSLYERLHQLDPDYAQTISGRDRHKIIRALEIITLTHQKVSDFSRTFNPADQEYDFRCWFVHFPKETLYRRLEMRCDKMVADGLIEEVKRLEKEGLRENISASQAIGYRQCLEFLKTTQSDHDWEEFVAQFKRASRRYAKRQFTWFRKEPHFRWLNLEETPLHRTAEIILQDYECN